MVKQQNNRSALRVLYGLKGAVTGLQLYQAIENGEYNGMKPVEILTAFLEELEDIISGK